MRLSLVLLFTILNLAMFGQLQVQKKSHNFGNLNETSKLYVDFPVKNNTGKRIFILRAGQDFDTRVKFSSKTIEPGAEEFIRIKYNPSSKGSFSKEIPVYFSSSNRPVKLRISGNVVAVNPNSGQACPDFSNKPVESKLYTDVIIEVIDKQTRKPISGAQIEVYNNPLKVQKATTGRDGRKKMQSMIGYHFVAAGAPSYRSAEKQVNFSFSNRFVTVELEKIQPDPVAIVEPEPEPEPEPVFEPEPEPVVAESPVANAELLTDADESFKEYGVMEDNHTTPKESVETYEPIEIEEPVFQEEELVNGELNRRLFKPNNIVFLLDVSTSMRQRDRIDIMKVAMKELLSTLRDIDQVAIVTYSSEAYVTMDTRSANQKEEIAEVIDGLKAKGFTAGGKGINLAYDVAFNHFLEDGNNEVIIATDGAFNVDRDDKEVLKKIKKSRKKGVTISVIGVKNGEMTYESLRDIADRGNGTYAKINSEEEARTTLLNQIKNNSKRLNIN